jgi:2-dehydropantoate 2-reductase
MDIVIIGAGAMGCLFGGLLAESGQAVRLIDIPGPHLTALQQQGVRLQTDGGDRLVPLRAGNAADFTRPCDLAIVFTKGMHTEAAMRSAAHLITPASWVLTAQNGLGNDVAIHRALPGARVAIGMTNWPAELLGPGHVTVHGQGLVRLWTHEPDAATAMPPIAALLDRAGLDCAADPLVEVGIWEKVAFNAALNAVAAVIGRPVAAIADHPSGRSLAAAIVAETAAVALARGIAVDALRIQATVDKALLHNRTHKPSMLQDVLAGRLTEIDSINGAIVTYAEAMGMDAPVTRTLRDLVRLVGHPPQ